MSVVGRCARAAAVGGGLGALWVLLASSPDLTESSDCTAEQFCFGYSLVVVPALLLAGMIAAWPLLYTVGVRPAVAPALLGPFVVLVLYYAVSNINFSSQDGEVPYLILSALSVLIGYVIAAFITAPELSMRWRVSALVVVLGLALLVSRRLI